MSSMLEEIRSRHVAAGDPGDPHCAECSDASYPIWPCDVAELLGVIDSQREIMDAQTRVSEQSRKRVQELANDLEHALASVGAFRAAIEDVWAKSAGESGEDGFIVSYVIPVGVLHRAIGLARGTDAGGKLLAERDAARAWAARWKAAAHRLRRAARQQYESWLRACESEREMAGRLAAAEAALAVCADAIRGGVWDVLAGGTPLPTPALKNLKLALTRAESVLVALAGSREQAATGEGA